MKKLLVLLCLTFSIIFSQFSQVKAQTWKESMDSSKFYQEKQDFQIALNWAQLALPQAEKEFGKNDTNYISILGSISELFYKLGKLDFAIYYEDFRLKICKDLFKGDNPVLANSMTKRGLLYTEDGNLQKAEPLLNEALNMSRRYFKGPNIQLIPTIDNLAAFYEEEGDYANAEPLYNESLEMRRHFFKGDHRELAIGIYNLANFKYRIDDCEDARQLFEEALEMQRRIFKGDNNDIAKSLNSLARALKSFPEDTKKIESLYIEALEMRRRIFKDDNNDLATSICNLAELYNRIDKREKAEPLFIEALEMRKRIFKWPHSDLFDSYSKLGYFYQNLSDMSKAVPLIKQSLEMYCIGYDRKSLSKSKVDTMSLYVINYFYNQINYYKNKIENIDLKDLSDKQKDRDLIYLIYKVNNLYEALCSYSNNLINNNFISLNENEKEKYFSFFSKYYKQYNNFAIKYCNKTEMFQQIMFDNQLVIKGMLLSASKKVNTRILSSNDSSLIQLFKEWKNNKEWICKLILQSNNQLDYKRKNLDSIVESTNIIERELNLRSDDFKKEYEKSNLTYWEDIQTSLGKDQVTIEIIRFNLIEQNRTTDTVYYVALIGKKYWKIPELVLLGNGKEFEELFYNKYEYLQKDQLTQNLQVKPELVEKTLKELYSQFWEKINVKLDGIKTVYVSPDGVYNKINLNTLINPVTNKYVIEEKDIRLITSSRDLVKYSDSLNKPRVDNTAVLFGDIKYNLDTKRHEELVSAFSGNILRGSYIMPEANDTILRQGFNSLPSSKDEINSISGLLKSNSFKVTEYSGETALEEAVKSLKSPRILHIATHGGFLSDVQIENRTGTDIDKQRIFDNPLLRSYLVFAGAENNNNQGLESKVEDGLLTAYEAMNLNLDNTELVVLSACETGKGTIKNGEGVYGLQRAFQVAGAKSIIMSLWKVSDKATKDLMEAFYSKWLSGKSKREAFRDAQLEIKQKYQNFFYWGAFVMVGE